MRQIESSDYASLVEADAVAAALGAMLVIGKAEHRLDAPFVSQAPIVAYRGGIIERLGHEIDHRASCVLIDPWLQAWDDGPAPTTLFAAPPILSPRNFGARGDTRFSARASAVPHPLAGVAAAGTNSAGAIQACLDATPFVEFNGWFRADSTLHAKHNGLHWRSLRGRCGGGIYSTVSNGPAVDFANTSYSSPPIFFDPNDPGAECDVTEDATIENVSLRGPFDHAAYGRSFHDAATQSPLEHLTGSGRLKEISESNYSIGIKTKQTQRLHISGGYITNFHRPVYEAAGALHTYERVGFAQFEIAHFSTTSAGWDGGAGAFKNTTHSFRNCRFQEGWIAARGSGAQQWVFDACNFETVNTPTDLNNGQDIRFANSCYFEAASEGPVISGPWTDAYVLDQPFLSVWQWGVGPALRVLSGAGSGITGGARAYLLPGVTGLGAGVENAAPSTFGVRLPFRPPSCDASPP